MSENDSNQTNKSFHWFELLWSSEGFIGDFAKRLKYGRAQNADQIAVKRDPEELAAILKSDAGISLKDLEDLAAIRKLDEGVVRRALELAAERHCFRKMPHPQPVTMEDILEVGALHIAGIGLHDENRKERVTEAFLRAMSHLIWQAQHSESFGGEIDLGEWKPAERRGDDVLWTTEWLSLYVDQPRELRETHESSGEYVSGPVNAYFWSNDGTQRAVDAATGAFRDVARSIANTVKLLARPNDPDPLDDDITVFVERHKSCPSLDDLFSSSGSLVFRKCAEAFFAGADKDADEVTRRMRIAVILLMEADRQVNDAIRLALSFSAIEALLCEGINNITEELSSNVATLLQPDRYEREGAIDSLRKLYDIRSRALHGDSLEIDTRNGHCVRRLAVAVISALVEWREYQRRMVTPQERKTFFKELKSAKRSSSALVGVPESLARFLPTK